MQQFVVVLAGDRRKLVPLAAVVEIVPMLHLTEVEGAGSGCLGAANLRGEIVPVFDLTGPSGHGGAPAEEPELPSRSPLSPSRFIVVAQLRGRGLGLAVDDIHDILALEDELLSSCPVGGGRSALLARVGEELLAVVDLAAVASHDE